MSRKVILYIAMSLDGYIACKNGDVSWLEGDSSDINADIGYNEFYQSIDTVIMGRKTYDQILTFGDYPYKGTEGYVYTSKDLADNDDVKFTNEDPEKLIQKLKKEDGKNTWLIGGAKLVNDFVKKDLVDEYEIAIIPCILGEGISLFGENNPEIKLKLIKHKVVNGIVMLSYIKRCSE